MPRTRYAFAALLLFALAAPALHAQPVPTTISYQGVLTDPGGTPVPNGTYAVTLRLFTAASGGSATYAENHTVTTTGGVFSAELGAGTPVTGTWAATTFDKGYWLETAVGGTTLAPRTKLLAGPYARGLSFPYNASVSQSGYLIDLANTNASGRGLQVIATGTNGVRGESAASTGSGITGVATSATGVSYGGFFQSESTSGQAVFAQATAPSGSAYGVYARSFSTSGRGVYGLASASSGSAYGVHGAASSTSGRGVYGEASATTGTTYGVFGEAESSSGRGVYGVARAASGTTYGVQGASVSSTGRGVYGEGSSTTGANYGGYFKSLSTSGSGLLGEAIATTGVTRGVFGDVDSPSGYGVLGTGPNTGVRGEAEATTGTTYGGFFTSASATGYGLYANNSTGSGIAAYFGDRVRGDNNVELYDGSADTQANIILDVDEGGEAPSIKLLRAGATVLELDAEHNGNARVITEELEITGGADLAEHFDVSSLAGIAPVPGMVLSIDPANAGRLTVASTPYDALVAGVVSGAGGVRPGFLMGQDGSIADGDTPVALVGRVYVLVDASYGAVRPGDLLTTSATAGHAMRAADREQAQGAVLGKAMTALESGRGLVLVLVGLQ